MKVSVIGMERVRKVNGRWGRGGCSVMRGGRVEREGGCGGEGLLLYMYKLTMNWTTSSALCSGRLKCGSDEMTTTW